MKKFNAVGFASELEKKMSAYNYYTYLNNNEQFRERRFEVWLKCFTKFCDDFYPHTDPEKFRARYLFNPQFAAFALAIDINCSQEDARYIVAREEAAYNRAAAAASTAAPTAAAA